MARNLSFQTLLSIFLALSLGSMVLAQTDSSSDQPELDALKGESVRVETTGGGNFQGTLIAVSEDRIEILVADGQILQISREAIKKVARISSGVGERAFYQDSASNRLIVMPTAFAMVPDELHIADQEIAVVTASYGLTENITIWGGISVPGALVSARFTSTFGDSFGISAGSFAGIYWVGPSSGPVSGLLIPYALSSWGEPNSNLTVGAGVPISFGPPDPLRPPRGYFDVSAVIGAIGGKSILTSTTALVTENWVIWGKRSIFNSETGELISENWDSIPIFAVLGLVFRIADSRLSWDIGAFLPLDISREGIKGIGGGPFIPFPLVSLTYRIL
jgi:preprotein translocase subunit YajC